MTTRGAHGSASADDRECSAVETHDVEVRFGPSTLRGTMHRPRAADRRGVLLLHGGPNGSSEGPDALYRKLADALARSGLSAVRFDFHGEGASDGDYIDTTPSSQVAQYRVMIEWLRSQGFVDLAVVGESFGATCALGGYRPDEVSTLVLLWPAVWLLDGTFAPLLTDQRMQELHDRGETTIDGRRIGQAFVDEIRAEADRATQLRTVTAPTLLIHGDADTEVPVRQSSRAFELLGDPKRLVVSPGSDHCLRRPHEQELVVTEVCTWLTTHLGRTSG